jgi:hypothetical protein
MFSETPPPDVYVGKGWDADKNMSVNAVRAMERGLLPATKIKGIPSRLIEAHCRWTEWHHMGKRADCVGFYDAAEVRERFGLEGDPEEADESCVVSLAEYRAEIAFKRAIKKALPAGFTYKAGKFLSSINSGDRRIALIERVGEEFIAYPGRIIDGGEVRFADTADFLARVAGVVADFAAREMPASLPGAMPGDND